MKGFVKKGKLAFSIVFFHVSLWLCREKREASPLTLAGEGQFNSEKKGSVPFNSR
jgi:hypothetical protein